jgi:carbonic anhydrase
MEFLRGTVQSNDRERTQHGFSVLPSAHRFAVLTCMDARVDASKLSGLPGSEAHIIRNAGGRVTEDAVRSLLLSHALLGTREWFVVQHGQCGMALLTDELTDMVSDGVHPSGRLSLLTQPQLLAADLTLILDHPAVPAGIPVRGFIYEPETGSFHEVAPAREESPRRNLRYHAQLGF